MHTLHNRLQDETTDLQPDGSSSGVSPSLMVSEPYRGIGLCFILMVSLAVIAFILLLLIYYKLSHS